MSSTARLPLWQVVAYSAPALPFSMLAAPSLTIIPALYMSWGGVGAQALALGLFLTRTAHAAALPVAGILSDHFFNTPARRAHLLYGATFVAAIAWWQWLAIEANAGAAAFIGWSLLLVGTGALFETNHPALAANIASRDDARVQLLSARSIASVSGTFLCFALLEWRRETDQIGTAALQWLTWSTILLLALCAGLFSRVTRYAESRPGISRGGAKLSQLAKSVQMLRNEHIRTLLSISALQSLAGGMTAALIFTFMDRMLGIAWAAPQIFMVGAAVGIVASLACPALVRGSSLRALIASCAAILGAVSLGLGILPLVEGGRGALMVLFVVAAMAAAPGMIAQSTLIARFVLPADEPSEDNQLASAYGLCAALDLIAAAIGAAFAFHLLPDPNAPSQLVVFLAVIGGIPAACHLTAALIAARCLPHVESETLEAL